MAMRLILGALLVFGFLFLLGCAQNTVPTSCVPIPSGAGRDDCIYKESVLAQEPFRCYNIEKEELRGACLSDATDEAAKKKLKTPPAQTAPTVINVTPTAPPQHNITENQSEVAEQYAECYRTNIPEVRDACLQGQALDRREIGICSLINSGEFRHECITNLAQLIRDPSICLVFSAPEQAFERDLCNANAKGGEIK